MAVLVSDSFNRVDSATLGSTDSFYGGTAKVWTSSLLSISTNQLRGDATTSEHKATIDCGVTDNYQVSFDIKATVDERIIVRGVDANNFYIAGTNAGQQPIEYNIFRVSGGAWTKLAGSGLNTITAGTTYTVTVKVVGNQITLLSNGTQILTVTDAAVTGGKLVGVRDTTANSTYDNFKVEDLATGTAYTKSLSDSVTTSDTISKLLSVTVFDSLSTSDGSSKADAKTLTDAMTVSDNPLTVNKGKAVNLSDSVSIVDAISKSLALIRSDSVATSEAESKSTIRGLLDTLTQSDSLSVIGGKAVLLSDSVTVSDSIRKAINLSKSDALAPTDNLTRIANTSVRLYDTLVTTETFSKSIPNAPVIIGTIELKGSRELNVYLLASRELTINLKGALPVAEKNQNISMYASESKIVGFTATDSNTGAALPLTGATLKWAMRRSSNSKTNDLAKALNSGITVTNAAAGKFTVTFNPADTVNLSGDFVYQAEVIDASGFENVVATGRVAISKNINK